MAIDLSANCVARWKLNENAGDTDVEDSSDNSHDGSAQRNTSLMHVSSGQPPYLNGAFDCNGTSDYITVPDHDAWDFVGKDFTVAFWFSTTMTGTGFFVNHRKKGNYNGWDIWIQTGQIWVRISKGTTGVGKNTSSTYNDGNWYFCTVEFDRDGTLKIYINASPVAISDPIMQINDISNNEDLCIGSRLSQHAYFDGVMDCMMIFDKLLSSGERAYLYNNGYGTEGLKTACRSLIRGSLAEGKWGLV